MSELHHHNGKRVMAMLLVFAMMFAMLGDYAPTWFTASAEEVSEDSGSSGSGDSASESHELSHSDDRHEPSHSDSGSSSSESSSRSESSSSGGESSSHSESSSSGGESSAHSESSSSGGESSAHSESSSSGSEGSAHSESSSSGSEGSAHSESSSSVSEGSSQSESSSFQEHVDNASATVANVTDNGFVAGEPSQKREEADETGKSPVENDTGSFVVSGEESTGVENEAPNDNEQTEIGSEINDDVQPEVAAINPTDGDSNDVPAGIEATAEVEVPTEGEAPSEVEAPTEVEAPAEVEAPVEVEAPAEVEATAEVEAPAEVEATAEVEAPAEDEAPAEVDTQTLAVEMEMSDPAYGDSEAVAGEVFTTKAFTAPVMLAASESESEAEKKLNIVQDKINEALAAVNGTLTGRVQILLKRSAVYEGDVSITREEIAKGHEIADDFEIEIAQDDSTEGVISETDGTEIPTKYAGTMTIQGINVAIRGISVTGMVNVESARLNYTGSDGADTVNVTAVNDAEVNIDTGAGDDSVTANVSESSADIKTGAGSDTVNATFGGLEADLKLDIDTGSGDDSVKLTDDAYQGAVSIVTGAGDDSVEVDAHTAGSGDMNVETGAGDDTVTLKNGGSAMEPIGKLIVSLGAGNDTANVDVSLSGAVQELLLNGGADDDTANFTGRLGDGDEKNKRVQIDGDKLKFIASNGKTLNVTYTDFKRLTDSLGNKETVKLTPKDGVLDYTAENPGINYTIEIPAKDIKNLKITSKGGKYLPLSNLCINVATEVDGANKLVISEGTVIDVRGLNLKLDSNNVEINGTIVANDVSVISNSAGKFLNLQGDSRIVITDKAAIYSSGDVMIIAKVNMSGPMLDTGALVGATLDIAPINSINVKIAHASVDIAGKVYAGVANLDAIAADPANAKPTFDAYHGSVTAKAETSVSMGVDEDGKPKDGGWPVAVSVANVEAAVTVQKGAVVEAAKDVTLASKSTLKAGTRASSGLAGAPAAVAVAVLNNDAHTQVDGTVNAHHGDAKITADGSLEATTVADRGNGQKMISGGYGAVTVALQDVTAIVSSGAAVTAGGNVVVGSNAAEKVVDRAASSSLSEGSSGGDEGILGTIKEKVTDLLGTLANKLKSWITGSNKAEKKLKKALELLPVSDKSVTLDSKAQQKGQVSADVVAENGKTKVKLNLEPWEGYEVKSITLRGYMPGESSWNVKTLTKDEIAGKKQVELDGVGNNMIVYVEYEEKQGGSDDDWQPSDLFDENPNSSANQDDDELDEDTWRPSDLFNLDDMLNDVQGGTDGTDAGTSGEGKVKLSLGGGVLTHDFLPGSPEKNLEKVNPGDAVRLIPNPEKGKKLKGDGLKATYFVKEKVEKDGKEEEKEVEKTIAITQDGQGRYILNVPETFIEDKGISVSAEFEDGAQETSTDESQTQITGSVAVSVAHNDNQALIEAGAAVVAGGSVNVNSNIKTDVETTADGSAVSKDDVPTPGPAAPATYPISRPERDDFDGYDKNDQFMFGMELGSMLNGEVEFKAAKDEKGNEIPYAFILTPKPHEGYSVASATLTYYQDGEAHTVELKKASDGTYRVELEKSLLGSVLDYYTLKDDCYNKVETSKVKQVYEFVKNLIGGTNGIDKGSNITINFTFSRNEGSDMSFVETASKPILNRIIGIKYNKLKDDENEVVYKETKQDGDKTYYVFKATADADKGYALDGKLKASWSDADSVELEYNEIEGLWYLDASTLPNNRKVTVTGEFKEELRDFKKADGVKNGTVTLYDEQVRKADKPQFSVTPDAGYSVEDIEITYTNGKDEKVTLKLSDKDSKITKVKDKNGLYTFTVEDVKENTEIKVNAAFKLKTIGVYAGQDDADKGKYVLSESNVASGDTVTVSLNEEDVQAGKKISEVKVQVQGKPDVTVKVNADGSFEVPKDLKDNDKLVVTSVSIVNKEVALEAAELTNGSVAPDVPFADRGDTVTVTVKPDDGFKIKKNTLKAVLKSNDGSYTEEVILRRQSDYSYAFTMPTVIKNLGSVKLSFVGEFEPGQSDSSKVETSVGAGIAVSVVNSEGRADIKGSVTGAAVNANAASEGAVVTESKAGYSAGNIGVGGAVSVQVASVDSKALIHESADLNADGAVSANATNNVNYRVNADASGNKEAGRTGVGAGIAVAVNGADTYAALSDKAKLAGALAKGIAVTANQTLKDAVSAKAGASGGSAGVPVAAVDVTGGSAQAYLGKVNDGALNVGAVTVSAANIAAHEISADASAAGKGVGVGAAIDVSVISDKANARLNQSVSAGDAVSVTTETESRLSSAATASASGGQQEADGGKNPDEQADGLLGMASKLAGMNGSDAVSQEDIEGAGSDKRQKAETGEGSVAVAGAVAVNVQKSVSRSEIMSGVDVKTQGALSVTALNGTTASVKANSSATNSNVGVGVGVAVNIVNLQNLATVSDGEIKAAMLKVAANTKIAEPEAEAAPEELTAEQLETLAKEEAKKTLTNEIGEAVNGFVKDLIATMGLDGYVSASLIGDITDKVAKDATQELLKTMELDATLGTMTFAQIVEGTKAAVAQIISSMSEDAADGAIDKNADLTNALSSLTDDQKQALKKVLESKLTAVGMTVDTASSDSVKEALQAIIGLTFVEKMKQEQLPTLTSTLMLSAKDGLVDYLKENIGGILSGLFADKDKEKDSDAMSKLTDQAGKKVTSAVSDKLRKIISETLGKTVEEVAVTLVTDEDLLAAGVDMTGILAEAVKEDEDSEAVKEASDEAAGKVSEEFAGKVPYKEMLEKLSGQDFKTKITDGLRAAAKQALITLTGESLNALTEHFDLALEAAENPATGHIIDTQAISGAGAKTVGVAGSVAVTVLNAETNASIAGGGKSVNVSGGMTVQADELRAVNNIASASADANGDAVANLDAGAGETEQTGGDGAANSTAANEYGKDKKQTVKLTVGVGGTAEIIQAEKGENRPGFYITLMEGYKLPSGNLVSYSYVGSDGKKVTGTFAATQKGDRWYVETKTGPIASAPENAEITLEVKPQENLHTVSGKSVSEGTVAVSVKDRKASDSAISARVGDLVQIKVDRSKLKGSKVSGITYTSGGKQMQVMLDKNGKPASDKTPVYALVSSNEKELIYTLSMPDADITDLQVTFAKAEAGDDSDTAAKDEAGRSVGVGAAFSMVYGNSSVKADVGSRTVKAGELSVSADSTHVENLAAAAGTDPLGANADVTGTGIKDFAFDASVALNILDNDILARVTKTSKVETTGYTATEKDEAGNAIQVPKAGDLKVTANETAVDTIVASAFSAGTSTAVGASVAINIANSKAQAVLESGAKAAGSATVAATGASSDVTRAVATALGADIARGLMKLNAGAQSAADGANSLLNGSAADNLMKDSKKSEGTDTNKKIAERLNEKKGENGSNADDSLSVSQNVLRSQGVETQSENAGSEGTKEAQEQIADNTDSSIDDPGKETASKVQVGAAVGVNVTGHQMQTRVGAIEAAGGINAVAENTGNFQTQGTGAAMSFAEKANSIAIGVAVSVNKNTANVDVDGDLVSTGSGDVNASAKLTQNLTGEFAGKLAAQSLSGSVAGKDSSVSLGGAVSVLVSKGEAQVNITGGSEGASRRIEGGSVAVESIDKSRLTSRAGGISLPRGSSVGMGIASNVIVSSNTVKATVGDDTRITADSFRLNAEKKAVTAEDFKQLISMRTLATDSSALTDEQRANANTGLIDYHKTTDADGKTSYQANVNLSSEKLLGLVDGLNFLSGQNTYVEAIAGSVATGQSKVILSGSVAVAVNSNDIQATMGKNVTVQAKKGDADVTASNGATTRVIAGSVSAAPADASVGVTVAVLVNSDKAVATTGDNADITAAGGMKHTADQTGDTQLFTGAMSVAKGGNALGGAINVVVNKSVANSIIGNNAKLNAGADADIHTNTKFDLTLISGSANVGTDSVAAGGTVNVIVDKAEAKTCLGTGSAVTADGNLSVTSDVSNQMISGVASASVAASMSGASGAGAVNVIVSKSVADTTIGSRAALTATNGDMKLTANNDAWMLNATLAAAGSGGTAIGGAFNVNVFDRQATVNLTDGTLKAGGNLLAQSSGRDTTIMAGLAIAGSAKGAGLSGNVGVLVEKNRINTNIAQGVTAEAGKNAVLEAYFSDYTVDAAGSIALSGTSAAVGATVLTVVKNNDVRASLGKSDITADAIGNDTVKSMNGTSVQGVYVGANASETQLLGAAGVSGGIGTSVNGVVDVLVNNNIVFADASEAALRSPLNGTKSVQQKIGEKWFWNDEKVTVYAEKNKLWGLIWSDPEFITLSVSELAKMLKNNDIRYVHFTDGSGIYIDNYSEIDRMKLDKFGHLEEYTETVTVPVGGSVTVQAKDDTTQALLAGGLSVSAGAGVGASVVTLVSNKTVRALAYDMEAAKDIKVSADNNDDVTTIAVSAGGGTVGVQIGAAVQVMKSNVNAEVGHNVNSSWGGLTVATSNNTSLNNAAVALAGAATAAVTPVGVVTYFNGSANTAIKEGSTVSVSQNVNVTSEANKEIGLYSVGAAVSGGAGVSGTANVIVSKDETNAKVGKDASVTATDGGMNVRAASDYDLTSATASVGAGTAGVAINAVVSVIKSKTLAEMAGKASLGGNLNVKARGTKDITNVGANLAAGAVGVGVNVMVLVTGTKMSQDAADMMANGGKEGGKAFNAKDMMSTIAKNDNGASKYYKNELNGDVLAKDTAGNGRRESKISVGGTSGSGKNKQGTFDGASGYRSSDFDNKGYNDDGDAQRGEKLEARDTRDVANAKKLNTYTYTDDPEDAVIARITDTAEISKAKDVTVAAEQPVTADLFGATVSGGAVGVGVTAAVAILRSNVLAESQANITATGNVNVNANSVSNGNVANRSNVLKKLLKGIDPADGGIRVIGATATVGGVGVAVGAGVALTDNVTSAKLGGVVTSGGANVNATQDYGHITAAVGALSAGGIAIGAAVGVAQSNAIVTSKIDNNASVTATGDVNVNSKTTQNVTSLAATAGVGGIAVNAGVAVAINRMTQNTGIGSGASVSANNINVKAASDTTADTGLLGISVGGVGVALGAAVSQVNANVNTLVEGATLKATGTAEVFNDVKSTATPQAVSLAMGGVAAGGNVLLAFNDTQSKASVTGSTVNAGTLNVVGNLEGTATSKLSAAQVGAFQVGLSVNYADMRADNRAILKDSTVNVKDLMVRTARDGGNATSAIADTVAGGMGFLALNMNAAIARNNSHSYAVIDGGNINATNKTYMRSYHIPTARASVTGVNAGALSITANVVVALNDADTRTIARADKLETGSADFTVYSGDTARADIVTGGGALFKADASIGVAYGRASSIVDVDVKKLTASSLKANSKVDSTANSKITNGSYAAVKAAALMGGAYSQDVVNTVVKLGDGSKVTGDTSVTTDYNISANSDVTPHKGGIDVNLANIGVNLSTAKSTAYAGADLVIDSGEVKTKGVTVQTTGKGTTNTVIRPTKIEVSLVKVATNKVKSDLSMTQFATIHLNKGSTLDATGDVKVQSYVTPTAVAVVGNSGADRGTTISLVNTDLSFAHAKENQASTAGIFGANKSTLNAANLDVITDNINQQSYTCASSNAAASYGFLTLGNLDARAISSDDFSSVLDKVTINASGRVNVHAKTNSKSVARGGMPGGFSIIDGGVSYTNADIGESRDYQLAQVLVGDGVKVNANQVELFARNWSDVDANLERGGAYSLAQVSASNQPTHTYVDTKLLIGKNVEINARDWLEITTRSQMKANSVMNNESKGVILNVTMMKGENFLNEVMRLDIGENTKLTSGGDMKITAQSTGDLNAETRYKNESYGLIGAGAAEAINHVVRDVRVRLYDGMSADAGKLLDIWSRLGKDDHIRTFAKMTVRSAIEIPNSLGLNDANLLNAINVGAVNLTSGSNLWLYAHTGGWYDARGDVDAATSVKLAVKPKGVSQNQMPINNEVNLNMNGNRRATLTSKQGSINIKSELESLHPYTNNFVEGSGAFGGVTAECINVVNGGTRVWIDNTQFNAQKGGTHVRATFGDSDSAFFEEKSEAALYGLGSETARSRLQGGLFARVLTSNRNNVNANGYFGHAAANAFRHYVETKCTGWWTSKGYRESEYWFSPTAHCDFCSDVVRVVSDYNAPLGLRIERGELGRFENSGWKLTSDNLLSNAFAKALAPINEVNRMVNGLDDITKARYGEEEDKAASAVYVMDVNAMLQKDVTMDEDRLDRCRLWTNGVTQQDVFLLPNATRFYRGAKLDYVSEVLRGDVNGSGESFVVDVFTALNANAFQDALIPVGSSSSLDFATGELLLPSLADFELYLHEVSGEWMLNNFRTGFFRRMDVSMEEAQSYILGDGVTLPTGQVLEAFTEGGEMNGWKLYWLGDTPDTAGSDDQMLVGILHNEETDELDVFRTSRAMMKTESYIDVSLYIFRNSKADRMGEEQYIMIVFDTPEGELSLVKFITDVLEDRELDLPKPLRVKLRGFELEGADLPVYSLTNHYFIMCDGTDGQVSLFDGFYNNTFDGDTFESDYIRIEGIKNDDLNVTLKKDQPIWPEKNSETKATDLNGTRYELVDNVWKEVEADDALAA